MAAENVGLLITVEDAAQRLQLAPAQVIALVEAEVLVGHDSDSGWFVSEESVRLHESAAEHVCIDTCEGRSFCKGGEPESR